MMRIPFFWGLHTYVCFNSFPLSSSIAVILPIETLRRIIFTLNHPCDIFLCERYVIYFAVHTLEILKLYTYYPTFRPQQPEDLRFLEPQSVSQTRSRNQLQTYRPSSRNSGYCKSKNQRVTQQRVVRLKYSKTLRFPIPVKLN